MNCLEFQRALRTEPNPRDAGLLEHAAACATCEASFRRARTFDRKLSAAVNLTVPENMASRILLQQSMTQANDSRAGAAPRGASAKSWWRKGWSARRAAIAASLVVATITAGVMLERNTRERRLGGEIVEMVEKATYAMMATGPVHKGEIEAAFNPIGLGLAGEFDVKVRFAGQCKLRGEIAGHLVLEGTRAPISVFVMPGQPVSGRSRLDDGHWSGVLMPAPGGSIAIIAAPGESIEALEARLRDLVRWQA